MKAHGSLRSIRNSILNPLESVVQQNKDLKKLLEDCGKQMAKVKEDQDTMLDNLQQEKKKCNALEDETMRLQLEITSLHQVESVTIHLLYILNFILHRNGIA